MLVKSAKGKNMALYVKTVVVSYVQKGTALPSRAKVAIRLYVQTVMISKSVRSTLKALVVIVTSVLKKTSVNRVKVLSVSIVIGDIVKNVIS